MMLVRSRVASVLAEWLPGCTGIGLRRRCARRCGARRRTGRFSDRRDPDRSPAERGPPPLLLTPFPIPALPSLPLPDLRSLRRRAAALASQLAARTTEGAEVTVDALTWRIAQSSAERVALTVRARPRVPRSHAPPLSSSATRRMLVPPKSHPRRRDPLLCPCAPSCRPTAATSAIPSKAGPCRFRMLGIQEGAAGLVDVSRATVTGRARVVLAGDGAALSFDADVGARALALSNPKLSSDTVRGLDVALRARGVASAEGEIRLDDFAATLGSLHLTGSGVLDQQPDFVTAAFRFEIPTAACQSLLGSVPSGAAARAPGHASSAAPSARAVISRSTAVCPTTSTCSTTWRIACRIVEVPDDLAPRSLQAAVRPPHLSCPTARWPTSTTGPGTANWTPLDEISPYMQVAVLTTEDGAFPHHHGFNHAAIRASIIANLKARRFVRGASTITMQLAKNLFLTREKTLSRKLEELVLTDYLEQTFTKDEIMELYLNVIEFGPAVYGITAAAEHYFGRTPAELNLAECSVSVVAPAGSPSLLGHARRRSSRPEGWMRTLRFLMQTAHKTGLITDAELAEAWKSRSLFWHGGRAPSGPALPSMRHDSHGSTASVETVPSVRPPRGLSLNERRAAREEPLKALGAFVGPDARHDLEPVIEARVATDPEHRVDRAALGSAQP